ncbi:uncharacterized protein METZ01_LOCUS323131, partial [marine metagenome]
CGNPNGECFDSGCTFCDGTNDPEEFVDCGANSEGAIICETDEDNWQDSFGNGRWDLGEEYVDENENGKYDEELCDDCADCAGNVDGIALMETVDGDWQDFWGESASCCESGELDLCGVCDGPGEIYECGCEGLPIDDDPASPTYGNQACGCDDGEEMMDDCGSCGGSNYFMLVDVDFIPTGEYCDESDGWMDTIPPEEYEDDNDNGQWDEGEAYEDDNDNGQWDVVVVLESCVLVNEEDWNLTNYCDCADTEPNECGLCIAEDTGEYSNEDQECCEIYEDCAGVCYGGAVENPCGECYGGTLGDCSLSQWENETDCEIQENGECTVPIWDFDVDGEYSSADTLNTE